MKASTHKRQQTGFTLIELLVVVAIIALLISILLPSLSRARAQARTTLCLSNVAQITKSFLLYASDYNETPPFVSTMHHYGGADNDVPDPNETWLVDCKQLGDAASITEMRKIAYSPDSMWDGPEVPRSGLLFNYARFEKLYRCPEFERVKDSRKVQNTFNYTRAVWARQYRPAIEMQELGENSDEWGDVQGPILKPSKIHAPGLLPMVLDEQWDRHVAIGALFGYAASPTNSAYCCNDYGFFLENIIGTYHGQPVTSDLHNLDNMAGPAFTPVRFKRGGVGYYDGHADLMRDPWPTFEIGNVTRSQDDYMWRRGGKGPHSWLELQACTEFINILCYRQRGFSLTERYSSWLVPPI